MCRVILENPNENVEFIMYNHLFSKPDYRFTVDQLAEELKQYRLNLSRDYIQAQVNTWVMSGLVHENFKDYSTCNR